MVWLWRQSGDLCMVLTDYWASWDDSLTPPACHRLVKEVLVFVFLLVQDENYN